MTEPNLSPLSEAFQNSVVDILYCGKPYADLVRSFAGAVTAGESQSTFDPNRSPKHTSSSTNADLAQWISNLESRYNASLNRCSFVTKQGFMGGTSGIGSRRPHRRFVWGKDAVCDAESGRRDF